MSPRSLFDPARLRSFAGLLWGLVLLTLPVTTFRYIPSIYGTTLIKPLALYPLALLLLVLLLLILRERRLELPRVAVPLAAFLLVVVITTIFGALYTPLDLRGQTYWGRALRGWLSLAVGLAFFFAAFLTHRSRADIQRSLKWLYLGLGLSILWGFVQILAIHTSFLNPEWVTRVQESFSQRGLHPSRISGFAYEPSWFADQIVILSFPWLVGAILTGYRLTRFKWLEPVLAALSAVILLFTYSRGGYLIAAVVLLVVVLTTARGRLRRAWVWFLQPFRPTASPRPSNPLSDRILRLAVLLVLLVALVGVGFAISQNKYFTSILTYNPEKSFFDYVNEISGGPRLAYALSGYAAYEEHPWTGVGLNAVGFYIYPNFPDFPMTYVAEIARRFSPDSNIIQNTKNFYVRLLSETGLVGFWLFIAFYLSILGEVRGFFRSPEPFLRSLGIAGLFTWLAVALRNFTQDSFAVPLIWVGLGMLLGLSRLTTQSQTSTDR